MGESLATICRRLGGKAAIRIYGTVGGFFMKNVRILLILASLAAGALIASAAFRTAAMSAVVSASGAQQSPQPVPTIASVVDRDISVVEQQIVDASDAMPEDKF